MTGQEAFEERFGFKAKGEFRCIAWFEIPLTVVGLAILVPIGIIIFRFLVDPYTTFGGGLTAVPVALAVWAIFCWWIVRIGHTGVTYRYEADDKEFRIFEPGNRSEVFYYSDVMSADYQPIYYLNRKIRGYKVTITTRYRTKTYKYIFSNNKLNKDPEGSPFFILEQRSGLVHGIVPEGGAVRSGEEQHGN